MAFIEQISYSNHQKLEGLIDYKNLKKEKFKKNYEKF